MASRSLPFLVFSSLSPKLPWRVVATETKRTISRHKILKNAVCKAERLNVQAISQESKTCLYQPADAPLPCGKDAAVCDLASESEMCLKHFREVSCV